jgi:hypothetical protein
MQWTKSISKKSWHSCTTQQTPTGSWFRVPTMNFLMVDGKGDPNTAQDYSDAVEALYSAAYAIKLLSRRTGQRLCRTAARGLVVSRRSCCLYHR